MSLATTDLRVPTNDGGYGSHCSFTVSYGLASGIVLGDDWFAACEPRILANDRSRTLRHPPDVDRLPPRHPWHPTKCSPCFFDLTLTVPLTTRMASIQLATRLHDVSKCMRR